MKVIDGSARECYVVSTALTCAIDYYEHEGAGEYSRQLRALRHTLAGNAPHFELDGHERELAAHALWHLLLAVKEDPEYGRDIAVTADEVREVFHSFTT